MTRKAQIAVVLMVAVPAARSGRAQPLTAEQVAVFRILDRFDDLDTGKLPFVKVATGREAHRHGYLLQSKGRKFRVRWIEGGIGELELTDRDVPSSERVAFEPVDIRSYAASYAKRLESVDRPKAASSRYLLDYYVRPQRPMNPTAFAIVLARACGRRGHTREVHELWKQLQWKGRPTSNAMSKLGRALDMQLAIDFSHRSKTWKDLHRRHAAWLKAFPDHWYPDSVREREKILRRMVLEEAERRAQKKRIASAGGTVDARVADLVFGLRNEYHSIREFHSGGFPLAPVGSTPDEEFRPSRELLKVGYVAAPALLAAIDDWSLTRTAYYSSRFGGGFGVVTVRSKAHDLLCRMIGEPLSLPPSKAVVMGWYEAQKKKAEAKRK